MRIDSQDGPDIYIPPLPPPTTKQRHTHTSRQGPAGPGLPLNPGKLPCRLLFQSFRPADVVQIFNELLNL